MAFIIDIANDAVFVHESPMMPESGTSRADFPGRSTEDPQQSVRAILDLLGGTRLYIGHDYPDDDAGPTYMATVAEHRMRTPLRQGRDVPGGIHRHARSVRCDPASAAAHAGRAAGHYPWRSGGLHRRLGAGVRRLGRLSDHSSRRTLMAAGAPGAVVLAVVGGVGLALGGLGGAIGPAAAIFAAQIAYEGVRVGHKLHLTDMAEDAFRARYTALSNTLVGAALLAGGLFGSRRTGSDHRSCLDRRHRGAGCAPRRGRGGAGRLLQTSSRMRFGAAAKMAGSTPAGGLVGQRTGAAHSLWPETLGRTHPVPVRRPPRDGDQRRPERDQAGSSHHGGGIDTRSSPARTTGHSQDAMGRTRLAHWHMQAERRDRVLQKPTSPPRSAEILDQHMQSDIDGLMPWKFGK